MGIRRTVTAAAAAEAGRRAAPLAATATGRTFLAKAIEGIKGFPGSREVAARQLRLTGDTDQAVKGLIEQHVRLAGMQGFLTQFGGALALPVTLPANIAGLAALQLRMTAGVAHLRGHDVSAPRVRTAALATLLGEQEANRMVEDGELTGTPRDLAFGPPLVDPQVQDQLTTAVLRQLLSQVTGKRATLTLTRSIPVLGGGIGGAVDAYQTWSVGRYADRELIPALSVSQGDTLAI